MKIRRFLLVCFLLCLCLILHDHKINGLLINAHMHDQQEMNCLLSNTHMPEGQMVYGHWRNALIFEIQEVYDLTSNADALNEQEINDLTSNADALNKREANGLSNAPTSNADALNEREANGLGNAHMLNEPKVECQVNDHVLNEKRVECQVNDHMLDKHRAKYQVDEYKKTECLGCNPKADCYVDNYTTANCLVDDHPFGECLGNGSILSDEHHHGFVNIYPYTVWWAKHQPCLVFSFNNHNHRVFSIYKYSALLNIVSPDKYKNVMQCTKLKLDETSSTFNPINALMSILQLYVQIMLTLLDHVVCHYNSTICISTKCCLIRLKLNQAMLRRHDFKVYMQSIKISSGIANGVALLMVSVFLYCQVLTLVLHSLLIMCKMMGITTAIAKVVSLSRSLVILHIPWKTLYRQVVGLWVLFTTCYSQHTPSDKCCNLITSFIGGGKANEFSYHEIQPYALSQNQFEASDKFKFISYMLKDDVSLYSNVESFVIVTDRSWKVVTPKLTIADLKTIAGSHGVFFHSKMNHRTLQTSIEDHICRNCSTYVSVFEFIDNKMIGYERKLSHSISVKKSQDKNPEKYRKENLAAVQKYNSKNPEKHSQQNLAAVKKFALENPEKHSQQNLAAVQKFAHEHPDKHSQQNLAAVQKFAHEHPDKHSQQNQAAVQKFSHEHPDKHSQQNLAAVQKFAHENPDKHSRQNLAAVNKFALENPDEHSRQNLAAVTKFALKNPDKHSRQNLAAVNQFKLIHPTKHQQQNLAAVQKFKLENPDRHGQINRLAVETNRENKSQFPPDPPSMKLQHTIISDFCKDTSPNKFVEAGCAVCGRLTPVSQLKEFSDIDMTPLIQEGVTKMERYSREDPIASSDKPVLIDELDRICKTCYKSLQNEKCPVSSLANGLWLGKVLNSL